MHMTQPPIPFPSGLAGVRSFRWLVLAVGLLFLLRLVPAFYVAAHHSSFVLAIDGSDYREVAQSVSRGDGFTITSVRWFEPPREPVPLPEAYRPLLLPLLAAPFLWGDPDSFFRLLLCQAVITSVLLLVLAWILRRTAGLPAAWCGVMLFTLHPAFASYTLQFSTEILFTLGLTLFVAAWVYGGRGKWALTGAAIAFAAWARPTAILLLPLSVLAGLLWEREPVAAAATPDRPEPGHQPLRFRDFARLLLARIRRGPWRPRLLRQGGQVAICLLLLLPAGLRNLHHFGQFKLTSFFGGYTFWVGNNVGNYEAYTAPTGSEFIRHQHAMWARSEELARDMGRRGITSPAAMDREWRRLAWTEEIKTLGWARWARLLAGKAWHFLRPWPQTGVHAPRLFALLAGFELLLYAAGIAGLYHLARRQPAVVLALLLVVTTGLVAHTLVHAYFRHRVPFVDLALIIGAAAWLGTTGSAANPVMTVIGAMQRSKDSGLRIAFYALRFTRTQTRRGNPCIAFSAPSHCRF
jgi:hypothetical protein